MNVLVTGAGGFLGGWLVNHLANSGATVTAWQRDERTTTLDLLGTDVVKVRGNVCDAAAWDRILLRYEPECVIHLAAESQVRRALDLPREAWMTNVFGTIEALEAARRRSLKGIIIASSDKAYGPPQYLPYDENHPLVAVAPYDASKAAADICARSYAVTYELPVVVVRAANLYGGGDLNRDRIVPETCRAILEQRDIVLRSDGSPERDYLYIEDALRAYELIMNALIAGTIPRGEVFNVGTSRSTSVRELVTGLLSAAGEQARNIQMILGPAHPRGEIDRQTLDASKIESALLWHPAHSLKEGLAKTWKWFSDHPTVD